MKTLFLQPGGLVKSTRAIFGRLGIPYNYKGTIGDYFKMTGFRLPNWAQSYSAVSMPTKPSRPAADYFRSVSEGSWRNPVLNRTNDELILSYIDKLNNFGEYKEVHTAEPKRLTDIAPIFKTAGKQPWETAKQYISRMQILPFLERHFPQRWGADRRFSVIRDPKAYSWLEKLFVDPNADIGFVPQKGYIFKPSESFTMDPVLAEEMNRRKIFPGIDFSKIDTVDDLSKITLALKKHPFVQGYRGDISLPLDIKHMYWFKGPAFKELPASSEQLKKNKWLIKDTYYDALDHPVTGEMIIPNGQFVSKADDVIPGTSITETDTSAASEAIKEAMAALKYGTTPGKIGVTRIFPERGSYYRKAYTGNDLHEANVRKIPTANGYDIIVHGKKDTPFSFTNEEIFGPEGWNSEKFGKTYDTFVQETLGRMPKFTRMLNEKNPTLQLSDPYVIEDDYFSKYNFPRLSKKDLFEDLFFGGEGNISRNVYRTPIYIDFYKHGGLIKSLKNIKNYAR